MKTVRRFLKRLKIGYHKIQPFHFWVLFEENENTNSKNIYIYILTFIAVLFTIARSWKQPKCPSTDEWIKIWYIYTMEYYSAIKKKEIGSFVETWMDLETVIQSEVS